MKLIFYKLTFIIALFFIFTLISYTNLFPYSHHQLNLSLTLSGHIIVGVGYCHYLHVNHGVQATFLIIPEKGFPFGLNGGYHYLGNGNKWHGKLGAELMLLVSPSPDRKSMSFFNIVPGIQYRLNHENSITPQLWISYIIPKRKIVPTGIEFRCGKSF